MTEPTAREALLSLADELDRKVTTEQHGDRAVSVWRQAAGEARSRAQGLPGAAGGTETAPAGGGEAEPLSVDPRAMRREARMAVAEAVRQLRCVQAGWAFGVPETGRQEWLDWVTRSAIAAAGPLIRTDERERIRHRLLACRECHAVHDRGLVYGHTWRPEYLSRSVDVNGVVDSLIREGQ